MILGVVGVGSLLIGLSINRFRERPLPLVYENKEVRVMKAVERIAHEPPAAGVQAGSTLPELLSLEEFRGFVADRKGTVLDARPNIFYRIGHVPGALNLPREDFETAYAANKALLEGQKTAPIAIYCSSEECEDATLVRKALVQLGFTKVSIFEEGWRGWTEAGLEEESAE